MDYAVSLKSPGRGEYTFGTVSAKNKNEAQDEVADLLVEAGFPRDRIGKQVTDCSTLSIGIHTVCIVPIPEFDIDKAQIMVALLEG